MPFEWVVALRMLRDGKFQTGLILAGIGVGVGVVIFLSALITGLQGSIIERTLGSQPHLVVRPPREEVRVLSTGPGVAPTVEQPPQRRRSIRDWPSVVRDLERIPGVVAASPTVDGAAFAVRGGADVSVGVRGIDSDAHEPILHLSKRIVAGRWHLSGDEILIGTELGTELGIGAGDKLRLAAPGGRGGVYTIAGVFSLGNRDLDKRWVFVPLRSAQTLFDLSGGVSAIEVTVAEIFEAERVAAAFGARTGLLAESWMKTNAQLLIGLRSQSSSSVMIQFFVIVAVALGIASVLVVSVVQKSREIGILRAMGTPVGRIVRVFLLQGALLGGAGSVLGAGLGSVLALTFASLAKNADGSAIFPVALTATLYLRTTLIALAVGVAAAAAPARRAAKLDPAEVIRYG